MKKDALIKLGIISAVGAAVTYGCEQAGIINISPTIGPDKPSNNSEAQEKQPYETNFRWLNDENKEVKVVADRLGIGLEQIGGFQIDILGAPNANGKITTTFINAYDQEGQFRSFIIADEFVSQNTPNGEKDMWIDTTEADGITIVTNGIYYDDGSSQRILEYSSQAADKLTAGQEVTLKFFPPKLTAEVLAYLDPEVGLEVVVPPNPNAKGQIVDVLPTPQTVLIDNPQAESVSAGPESSESTLPAKVIEKFNKAGIDMEDPTNWVLQKNGDLVINTNGEVKTISASELDARTTVRRDGTFQILDKEGKNVEIAFDKQNNTFELKSDYVYFPEDRKADETILMRVAPEDKVEFYRKEKLFFADYPLDVFQPDPDMINNQFGNVNIFKDQNPEGKYQASTPYGSRAGEMFKLENIFIVEKDPINNRPYDTVYITQSFAIGGKLEVMHFVYDLANKYVIGIVQDAIAKSYLAPINGIEKVSFNAPEMTTFRLAYQESGLDITDVDNVYYLEYDDLLIKSFETGSISPELIEFELKGIPR